MSGQKTTRKPRRPSKKENKNAPAAPLQVLVIDDDPVFCRIMKLRGENMDMRVTTCTTLSALEDSIIPEAFDVAIVDYYLDGMKNNLKGTAIARWLQNTPVILVSRDDHRGDSDEVWPRSIREFVGKESGPKVIFEAARAAKAFGN